MDSNKSGLWKGRLCDDGILAEMYNYIWLVLDGMASGSIVLPDECSMNLSMPDTILYERGFPKAWYAWEKAARGDGEKTLRKHLGKDIAVPAIIKKFCAGLVDQPDVVVAEYITLDAAPAPPSTGSGSRGPVQVRYLTQSGLAAFLSGRASGSIGVLQRFTPTAGMFNTAYEVVWSPSASTIAQARSAVPMSDTLLSLRERFATFDADPTQLRRVKISPQSKIREKLLSAVTELMRVMSITESIPMLGAVVYCKIDMKGTMWLTFCSSIRCKTVQSGNGVRDPLEVGADFKERTSAPTVPVHMPPSRPANAAVNMRSLPKHVRVHVVAGGRTSPLILGQAYDVTARANSLADVSAQDNNERWRAAMSRLDNLQATQLVVEGDGGEPPRQTGRHQAAELPKTSSSLPDDHHKGSRQALLLFLEDMVYMTRANRDRTPHQGRVAAEANASLPSFFNDGIDFHFRIPPALDRALGASGLATICRILGWERSSSLSDAHGHNADFFTFPWRAPVATNEELLRVVMSVYPPAVVRKGRRSVAARSMHSVDQLVQGAAQSDDDDDEDDDRRGALALPTSMTTRLESSTISVGRVDEDALLKSVEPILYIEPLVFSLAGKRIEQRPHLEQRLKSSKWHMSSSFPDLGGAPRPPRRPLSAKEREGKCRLSASRKRIYYPEGTVNKPGPAIQRLAGLKQPPNPVDVRSPLSNAAAQYIKNRHSPDAPEEWTQRAPFAGEAATQEAERKPLDIMMQFWTQ